MMSARYRAWLRQRLPSRLTSLLSYWKASLGCKRALWPWAHQSHNLPGRLLISLTSFPPRFATLDLTLRSLKAQRTRADDILLWIAHDDMHLLPRRVIGMRGVTIYQCEDIRSYKKLIFTLEQNPGAFVATADDDVFYPHDWLGALVSGVRTDPGVIAAHRVHRVHSFEHGAIASYNSWSIDVQDDAARQPSVDLMPIGIGGVLYPPYAFDHRVFDRSAFTALAPHGDDLWFWWMARLAGTKHVKVGPYFKQITWERSQSNSLFQQNERGGNDKAIHALSRAFGSPPAR